MVFISVSHPVYFCPTCNRQLEYEEIEFERVGDLRPVHRIVVDDGPDELHLVIERTRA